MLTEWNARFSSSVLAGKGLAGTCLLARRVDPGPHFFEPSAPRSLRGQGRLMLVELELLPPADTPQRCRVGTSKLCGTKDEGVAGGNDGTAFVRGFAIDEKSTAGEGLFLKTSAHKGEVNPPFSS
eukprot:760031-Hanusia_phi.AAC.4